MRKWLKRALWTLTLVFTIMNVVAAVHAWKFTHFSDSAAPKTKDPSKLSIGQKLSALFLGVVNPRPVNTMLPGQHFETIKLQSNTEIECWWIKHEQHSIAERAKGTVILFHGFSACKQLNLDKSDEFYAMGYDILLVDFMGSGGSGGVQTTIGFKEAEEVKTCYDFIRNSSKEKIFLFGSSMGAVAIIKSISDYGLGPDGIIIECPFGTMYQTTCSRFRQMHVPVIPMAALLDFWGGAENGFNAFSFSPINYAKSVKCPTLLLYGARDQNVSRNEIDEIYNNLNGPKQLCIYPLAGHENYLKSYKQEWVKDVGEFIGRN